MKVAGSSGFVNFKEFDGQSLRSLVEQQQRIRRRFPSVVFSSPQLEQKFLRISSDLEHSPIFEMLVGKGTPHVFQPGRIRDNHLVDFRKHLIPVGVSYYVAVVWEAYTPIRANCSIPVLLKRQLGEDNDKAAHLFPEAARAVGAALHRVESDAATDITAAATPA